MLVYVVVEFILLFEEKYEAMVDKHDGKNAKGVRLFVCLLLCVRVKEERREEEKTDDGIRVEESLDKAGKEEKKKRIKRQKDRSKQ